MASRKLLPGGAWAQEQSEQTTNVAADCPAAPQVCESGPLWAGLFHGRGLTNNTPLRCTELTAPSSLRTGFFCRIDTALVLFFLLSLSFQVSPGLALEFKPDSSWNAHAAIHDAAPPLVVGVDKAKQSLYLIERAAYPGITLQYICTTGRIEGDKLSEGDLRTPEGVYFVVRRLDSGLNFTLYGNEAYPLNYPNPVDRLRKKTGYGIWIHGRGEKIRPLMTQGCVALNNEDIAFLGKMLTPGTPVVFAQVFDPLKTPGREYNEAAATLAGKAENWARAWENRSAEFFSFYDQGAYSIAQGSPFSAFKAQKERLFRVLPWIKTSISDVQVLSGPGYWVTWFHQDYAAPNLTTRGVRRLYWERTPDNDFKIVGMEWIPGMTTSLTMASLDNSGLPSEGREESGGQPMSEEQAVPLPEAAAAVEQAVAAMPDGLSSLPPRPDAATMTSQVKPFVEHWRKAWQAGDIDGYIGCYAPNATQGKRRNAKAIRVHKEALWARLVPAEVALTDVTVDVSAEKATVTMNQEYRDVKGGGDKGLKTLILEWSGSAWRIVDETWSAGIP